MSALLFLLVADFGFSSGVRPLDIGVAAAEVRADACGVCHERQLAEWVGTRHRASATNALFAAGLAAETEARCVRCHAPLSDQFLEVAKTIRGGPLAADAIAREGITCAVCHVRDGDGHGRPELLSDELCGSCHQFEFHEKRAGQLILTNQLIQSTYDEWQRFVAAGGQGTCRSCHMPEGSHDIRGAHDIDLLKRSLVVEAEPGAVVVRSVGVGHDLPTGDVFRHATVEVFEGGAWRTAARIGRRYEARANDDGSFSMALVEHTSLAPKEVRRFETSGTRFRVRYRFNRIGDVFSEVAAGPVPQR